jgi:hypothetical protein
MLKVSLLLKAMVQYLHFETQHTDMERTEPTETEGNFGKGVNFMNALCRCMLPPVETGIGHQF